jgi:hypothetical protein
MRIFTGSSSAEQISPDLKISLIVSCGLWNIRDSLLSFVFFSSFFGPWGTVPSGPFQAVQQCMVFFGTKRVITVVRQTEKRFAGVDSRL